MESYPPFLDIYGLIYLLAIGQALFLSIILFLSKNTLKRRASILMAIIILLQAVDLSIEFLFYSRYMLDFPFLTHFSNSFKYTIPPLLLLYVLDISGSQTRFHLRDLLYFLPFFYHHWSKWPLYLRSNSVKTSNMMSYYHSLENTPTDAVLQYRLLNLLSVEYFVSKLFPLLFVIAAVVILERYLRKVKQTHSNIQGIDLKGTRIIFRLQLVLIIVSLGISIVSHLSSETQQTFQLMQALILSIFIYAVAYFELSRPKMVMQTVDLPAMKSGTKYKGSNLTPERSEMYLSMLTRYIEENKAYQDANLSLRQLSTALEINTKYLSQVINEQLGVNFFDFINSYRIEEAKKRLADPTFDHLTIEAIGLEVGFNSKIVFYRTFRKFCQMTPKEYKNSTREA